mmetsp:Transcript_5823/g.8817  ORF Transcript_5823/g.8817 Transcript_5823/m.8817 type:complete len:238 (+) Transcript_5823:19-732(+)
MLLFFISLCVNLRTLQIDMFTVSKMIKCITRRKLSWWPVHLPASNDMNMQMEYLLSSNFTIIYHNSIALEVVSFGNFGCHHHEMPENASVLLCSIAEAGQRLALLGDDQDVGGALGVDIPEGQALVILMHNGGRNLLSNDLVEDRGRIRVLPTCPEDGVEPPACSPAIQRPLDLRLHLLPHGEAQHVVPPLLHLGPKHLRHLPPKLGGQDLRPEHGRGEDRDVRHAHLGAGEEGTLR